jgi:peptidylprolyl isomerase
MNKLLIASLMTLVAAAPAKKLLTPNDVVAQAPASAWRTIPADDLLVMDLANIRALARANYWNGATVYRVQDNYVAQWGQNESDKPWPAGVTPKPPAEYTRPLKGLAIKPLGYPDAYAPRAGFAEGWPIAYSPKGGWADLTHCYGYVGIGRDLSPDTGTGGELYAVIGHAPRHLDRNIAVVGRVIDGIDKLSSLPRGTEALGFYKDKAQYVPIAAVRLASQMPPADRPSYEYLDTMSDAFAAYLRVRANRHDDFYIRPAGGVDVCNVQVPVRKKS